LSGLQIEMPQQPSELNREEQENEFVEAIATVERSLAALKERYTQIQRDRQRQAELGHRREDVRQSLHQNPLPQLKKELREIEQELETIELNLESSLFSWGSIKQPFWQAVRFGGLGILLGWMLKSYAG
jgi:seryl-tRNA synthetase